MIGKFVSKIIQSLPTWEVTKYYGRVCMYQLKCLKYKFQTSEAWFNFKCKFMPGSLQNEIEYEDSKENKDKTKQGRQKMPLDSRVYQKQKQLQYKNNENDCTDSSYNDVQSSYTSKKKQKYQNKDCYSMQDNYRAKKQRKVKRAQ